MPTAPKLRQVISLLVLRRNALVKISEFIDEVWQENPPASVVTTLQTYIYKIRKILGRYGAGELLHTRPGGYLLTIPDSAVDLHRFERGMSEGRTVLEQGDPARASEILARSLEVWRGPALADVATGELLSAYVTRLEENRFLALELRIEADLRLGRHVELISELKSLVVTHPLHERFHASLMMALHHSGRRSEALAVYGTLRRNVVEDLGLEPGQELQRLHQTLLSSDPPLGTVLDHRPATDPAVHRITEVQRPAPPAQLPYDLTDFTGRAGALGRVTEALAARPERGGATATRMVAITGMPGVGKSVLAVHAAHLLRSRFGDGQLYAGLNGSQQVRSDVGEVLAGFLRSLGVPPGRIPEGLEERSKLFRSTSAGRRLLLVLDDVASATHVRPLLPGDPSCAVIITGRRRPHGLPGAEDVSLDVMDTEESTALLALAIGGGRTEREPRAAAELAALTGGLPLALRCIAGRLMTQPGLPLAELVKRLRNSTDLLAEFQYGDSDVRSRYDSVYEGLTRREQGAVRLLSMLPAEEFTAGTAAEVLGWEVASTERVLEAMLDGYVLRLGYVPGETLYAFPEITRLYARERLLASLSRTDKNRPSLSH
ncbi:BTAD domain-containing putative transcriptional regulator [Streptomyces sp. NPDC055036]